MIQNLKHIDLVRLLRGCNPDVNQKETLLKLGLGEYAGEHDKHWEWAREYCSKWGDFSEEDLWKLYENIIYENRMEAPIGDVFVVLDSNEYDNVRAVFTKEDMAERYRDANGRDYWPIQPLTLNPDFEEPELIWSVSLHTLSPDIHATPGMQNAKCVGYVHREGEYLRTWVKATTRPEAIAKANDVFMTVARGREKGMFRYLNTDIYIPDRVNPDIRKYPYYDVASGKIVIAKYGSVILPKSEALLPDGTPNPELFILIDDNYVNYYC